MPGLLALTGFLAGLLGSTHCLGMCGGISLALGGRLGDAGRRGSVVLLYNFGRITSYTVAGTIAGAVGSATTLVWAGSQAGQYLRVAAALSMVVIGLNLALGANSRFPVFRAAERWGAHLWRRASPVILRTMPTSPMPRALATGLAWGWLPCGLVYSSLAAATVAGNASHGALTMFAFGLGTLPAMTGLSYFARRLVRMPPVSTRLAGAGVIVCGLWTAVLPIGSLISGSEYCHMFH